MDSQALEAVLAEDEGQSPEQICEVKIMKEELCGAISRLNKKQRDIVILRVYFERTFQEIAKLLKMNETAVKVNYHRAKALLKKQFY